MSLEAELKKFELSSVFTINFSWLKRYVESDNGMYTPMKNISDDEFREIENSFYALQATWKAWREAKAQAVPKGFVLVSAEQLSQWGYMANYAEEYGCPECFEARGYAHSLACEINEFFAIEAQEPAK